MLPTNTERKEGMKRYYVARVAFEFDSDTEEEAEAFLKDITEMIREDRERRQQYLNNYTVELSIVTYQEYQSVVEQVKEGIKKGVKEGARFSSLGRD